MAMIFEKFEKVKAEILASLLEEKEVTQEERNRFDKKFPSASETQKEAILSRVAKTNYNIYQHNNLQDVVDNVTKLSKREQKKVWNGYRGEYLSTAEANEILKELLTIKYDLNDAYASEVKDVRDMWNVAKLDDENLKDLFSYNNFSDLKNAVTPKAEPNEDINIKDFPEDEEGAETIYMDDEIALVKITSYDASRNYCHNYGGKASWCISYTTTRSHWDRHVDDKGNSFVFLLKKDGDKYAFVYTGEDHEIYNRQDQLTSSYKLVKQYPQIVEPLRKVGAMSVNRAEDMKAEPTTFKTDKGEIKGTTVVEVNTGLGDMSGTITSYLDENDDYLDIDKHNHPAMKIE